MIAFAVNEMNHRSLKTLGFRASHALFFAKPTVALTS